MTPSDDGYSGMTFDRPDVKKMLAQVDSGEIGTIIVKDQSRLGRNRLIMGMLLEETFPMCDVRYIAITDNIDTIHGVDDSVAVRDLFNEWRARDTSKKIKAVIMASAKRGERIGTKPYGYKKHPDAPKQIVPNPDTAPIVRRIFSLCSSGLGPDKIARMLKDEQILTPTVYEFRTNGVRHTNLNEHKPFVWCGSTVADILEREEYIGTTINCRSFHPSQQFQMLTQGYEDEKQELSQRIALLEREISSSQDKMLNSDRFLKLVEKYTDIQELTPELVREFIDKIVVHERSEPRKKKNYTQQVDVYFNFVGKV